MRKGAVTWKGVFQEIEWSTRLKAIITPRHHKRGSLGAPRSHTSALLKCHCLASLETNFSGNENIKVP